MKEIINRAKLRGKPLDEDCKKAKTTSCEYGIYDGRIFCLGIVDMKNDEYLSKCRECGAFVDNAEPIESIVRNILEQYRSERG